MLCAQLEAGPSLPFTVESAMRLGLLQVMDFEAWLDLFVALQHAGLDDVLGLPDRLPRAIHDAADEIGCGPNPLALLREVEPLAAPPAAVAAAAEALGHASAGLLDQPLCWVRAVRGTSVQHRTLVGTAHPMMRVTTCATAPPVAPGLWFWDGEARATPVPPWLARWEEPQRTLRLYGGRDGRSGQWRYGTRQRADDVTLELDVPVDMPAFLADPAWRTPAPARNGEDADTALFHRPRDPEHPTARMAEARVVVPALAPTSGSAAPPAGSRLVMRVVRGPDLMRYVPLSPDAPVIVGRNHGFASFVVHHHQVSRSHTRIRISPAGEVRVQDLRSTNGTTVQGVPLKGDEEQVVRPGQLVGVGPVLLRLEWITPALEERLQRIERLVTDEERRDPVTLTLRPGHLVEELPEVLRAAFRSGSDDAELPSLWGILLYIDRLAALHAQHGARVADRTFRDVARVLQYEVPNPERWVRVGYGELLLPRVGVDEADTEAEAERLVQAVQAHPWTPPADPLTVTAAIVRKLPEEPASEWLRRARRILQEGRSRGGRSQVYTE